MTHGSTILVALVALSGVLADYHDKTQTGITNIHLVVSDFNVYGLAGDFDFKPEQNDYAYDYADLTVKPENESTSTVASTTGQQSTTTTTTSLSSSSTTYKPVTTTTTTSKSTTSTTTLPTSTGNTIALLGSENNTIILTNQNKENGTEPNKLPLTAASPLNSENYQIPVMVVTDNAAKKGYVSSSSIRRKDDETPALPGRKCLHGFYLDSRNRCKPISRKPVHSSKEKPRLPNGLRYAQRPDTAEPVSR